MFMICEAMKWNHLPSNGGLYDQHPDLLDGFLVIFAERAKYEEAERKREQMNSKNKSPASRARRKR